MSLQKIDLKMIFSPLSKIVSEDLKDDFEKLIQYHRAQVAQVAISVAVIIWLTSYAYDLVVYPEILWEIWTVRTIVCGFLIVLSFLALKYLKGYPFVLLISSLGLVSTALSIVLVYANDLGSPYILAYVLFLGTSGAILNLKVYEAILGFFICVGPYFIAAIVATQGFDFKVAFSIAIHCATMSLWGYLVSRILTIISYNNLQVSRDNEEKTESISKKNLELQKLHDEKSRLLANISHEFRTPLTLILSPIDKVKGDVKNQELVEQYLDVAQGEGLRLLRLVNNLLDSFYAESNGGIGLKDEPVNLELNDFLAKKEMEYKLLAETKNILVTFNASSGTPCLAKVYLDEFEKVISNVLVNAIKYTESGGVDIYLEQIGDNNVLSILDSGIGVEDEELEKIFDRFYTGNSKSSGVGIGLNLAKTLINSMGGDIYAEHNKPSGLKVIIKIPIAEGNIFSEIEKKPVLAELYQKADKSVIMSAQKRKHRQHRSSKNVLVVEDEINMRNFIVSIFDQYFNVIDVDSGEQALSILETQNIDLVITDFMLPKMNGIELSSLIRNNLPNCRILMLSANQDSSVHKESLENGVDEFFIKPFNRREVFGKACRLIGESSEELETSASPSMLIVEENDDVSRVIESAIDDGVKIFRETSIKGALDILDKWVPDMITLDVQMADRESQKAIQELKEKHSATRLIIFTSRASAKEERLIALENADELITKPFDVDELKARLKYQMNEVKKSKLIHAEASVLKSTKDMEVQKEKLALLGELNMNVMHEIKNPLNFSLTAISLIEAKVLKSNPDFVLEACGDIKIGLEQIKHIVNDMQSTMFDQAEKGLEEVWLENVIGQSIHMMKSKINDVDIQVICPSVKILSESSKLKQVLINLIDNALCAVKECNEKWVVIRVYEEDKNIVILFSDSGRGIDKKNETRLFEKFYTTKDKDGMGVGLPLSKSIMDSIGGSLCFVENNPGAVFKIEVPKEGLMKENRVK